MRQRRLQEIAKARSQNHTLFGRLEISFAAVVLCRRFKGLGRPNERMFAGLKAKPIMRFDPQPIHLRPLDSRANLFAD